MVINCYKKKSHKAQIINAHFLYAKMLYASFFIVRIILTYLMNSSNKYWVSILNILIVFIVYLQVVIRHAC